MITFVAMAKTSIISTIGRCCASAVDGNDPFIQAELAKYNITAASVIGDVGIGCQDPFPVGGGQGIW